MLFEFSKSNDVTMKDIYEEFIEYLEKEEIDLHWNTTESALKFLNEKVNSNQNNNSNQQQINLTMSKKEWKYFNALRKSFTDLIEPSDWSTKNIGSFFIPNSKPANLKIIIVQISIPKFNHIWIDITK